jgi:Ca2+-binding RTX toxin-like protein
VRGRKILRRSDAVGRTSVRSRESFYGGAGDDDVSYNGSSATFDGGDGNDSVGTSIVGGTVLNVP